ncbi:hypothetical protein [Cryobacterium sp. M23]|uniref:hypothetical protein n=1 Tax=Cryobacterium sp. M23 TaxID=2048292 RepID=UPI000CE31FE7|nr:hypothetical protein [Cryobacterium sp. M23]
MRTAPLTARPSASASDPGTHFSCSRIIADDLSPAVGQAVALSRLGNDRVAVADTGEGAANQGTFRASLFPAGRLIVVDDDFS